MQMSVIIVFVLGYLAIAFENVIRINKTASALVMGVACWALYSIFSTNSINAELSLHLGGIAEIIFFLIGAMTIVELIDSYQGFGHITKKITTRNPKMLLWIICWITFFLSSVLDNLTTAIVMVTITRKLIPEKDTRMIFAGMTIIAANAGGAWSPIGDVTTTMLWMGGQITSGYVMKMLFLPSTACLLIPLLIISLRLKTPVLPSFEAVANPAPFPKGSRTMLIAGIIAFLTVPFFKMLTGLPPYTGILIGLGVLWLISESINPDADEKMRNPFSVTSALSRIDISSTLFFLGILLAVASLETIGTLARLAAFLAESIGDNQIIVTFLGLFSAVVDNVPLVAATTGMYDLTTYPANNFIWEYIAYCTGTGGSILIIGSAAGVAVMGMEKMKFSWYLRRISLLALIGYFSGAAVYVMITSFIK